MWNFFKVYSTTSHYFSTHSFTVKEFNELGVRWIKNIVYLYLIREVGGAAIKLLGVGRAADHLVDGLGDGVTVDAIELEQLLWFTTAGDMGHSQTMQIEARLIDHCWGHGLPEATCGTTINHMSDVSREDKSSLKDGMHTIASKAVDVNWQLKLGCDTKHEVITYKVNREDQNILQTS